MCGGPSLPFLGRASARAVAGLGARPRWCPGERAGVTVGAGAAARSGEFEPERRLRERAAAGDPEVGAVVPGELGLALEPAQQDRDTVEVGREVQQQRRQALELGAGLLDGGQRVVEAGLHGLLLGEPAERGRARRYGPPRQLGGVGPQADDLVQDGPQPGQDGAGLVRA